MPGKEKGKKGREKAEEANSPTQKDVIIPHNQIEEATEGNENKQYPLRKVHSRIPPAPGKLSYLLK